MTRLAETPGLEGSHSKKYLGEKGFIALITLLSAFIPLSIDIYLPALPGMAEDLQVASGTVNLTLTVFFIFYAVGTLFWGPLSDRYGRKPVLMSGLVTFTAASIFCALAGNVYQLIFFRILQAVGCGAVTAAATAVVKDVYSGRKRETVLALVQSMVMISPIVAPVVGAIILGFSSWRGAFWALTLIGLLATIGGAALPETIRQRSSGSVFKSLQRLVVVAQNPGFSSLMVTFTILAVPNMAFISASSYIYINQFGLGEKAFSYFFAANAAVLVISPLLYIKVSQKINSRSLITYSFIITMLSGLLMSFFGQASPWAFTMSLLPASAAIGLVRPPTLNLMLEQQQHDTGSAVSLIFCVETLMGSLGVFVISYNWSNLILVMGLLHAIFALLSLGLWLWFHKKPYIILDKRY